MKSDDVDIYTIVNLEQKLIQETFPSYTLCLGLGMYATHYFVVFVFLGFSDPSLKLDRIIWLGTYITPYIFPFWGIAAFFILITLFFRDYRMGFRQIKLEPNQITLYPKHQSKELQILSWKHPIQSILLAEKNTSFKVDLENRSLQLPSIFYPSAVLKIRQFYKLPSTTEELSHQSEFQDED
ncbi:MAG: hypothetical protein ACI976_003147 [Aureispira sp.]|jgi:hypothetical protein